MTFNEFISSKKFSYLFYVILIVALILLVFRVGMIVGSRNAALFFEHREMHGDQWDHMQSQGSTGPMNTFMNDPFGPSHGTFGTITAITSTSSATGTMLLDIEENNGNEKTVLVSTSTDVDGTIATNDRVVVLGFPNDHGEIEARLIRVFPNPDMNASTTIAASASTSINQP
jgi:hypothetical protein